MIKIMIMALCLSSNEATIASESVTTEIWPGNGKSKGYNYKKHYKKRAKAARRKTKKCPMTS
jgi:hypothetical protein